MAPVPPWFYRQSGALPVRREGAGVQVLLVTSRKGKRWVIPKGVVEPGLTPPESAAKEAWEEAGVRGRLRSEPLGSYRYRKWEGRCTVEVFLLEVESVAERWPEEHRTRRWAGVEDAARAVREPDLQSLIRAVPSALAPAERREP